MALPYRTTGSLYPGFPPDRLVSLTVKLVFAIALYARLPSVLNEPLEASDTLSEATTPVKLPIMQCLRFQIRHQRNKGRYFKVDSPIASATSSQSPAIRAGRNLPDKEFRYLRTVIVTAAVYWGFSSMLRVAPNIPP